MITLAALTVAVLLMSLPFLLDWWERRFIDPPTPRTTIGTNPSKRSGK